MLVYFNCLQENRSYSLWVTAFDGSIPQRTEVLATITDNNGLRPKLPQPPPFNLPKYPSFKPNIPLPPSFTSTTRTTQNPEEETFQGNDFNDENTTSKSTTPTTEVKNPDVPKPVSNNVKEDVKDKELLAAKDQQQSNEVPKAVIPMVAVAVLLIIVAAVVLFLWKKNSGPKKKSKKEDMVRFILIIFKLT